MKEIRELGLVGLEREGDLFRIGSSGEGRRVGESRACMGWKLVWAVKAWLLGCIGSIVRGSSGVQGRSPQIGRGNEKHMKR